MSDHEVEHLAQGLEVLIDLMDVHIGYAGLRDHLIAERPDLVELLRRDKPSRLKARGDWERVMIGGFKGAPLADETKNSRRRTSPDFFGDGTLRFEAIAEIDFDRASALDLIELIDSTLAYLSLQQPERDPGDNVVS